MHARVALTAQTASDRLPALDFFSHLRSTAMTQQSPGKPLKMVYEKDAPLDALKGKTVAIIGFGSQGHAHAQNLRDSGIKVIVANRKESPNGRLAIEKGFNPVSVEEAVKAGDLIIVTLPDE